VLPNLCGLLGQLERKNGWTLAEAAGEVSPDGTQRLLRTADWSWWRRRRQAQASAAHYRARGQAPHNCRCRTKSH